MKVGLIMLALALALVITAMVVSATLRSEPERAVAAEVAAKSPGEAPRYSSGEEWSATRKPLLRCLLSRSPNHNSGANPTNYTNLCLGSNNGLVRANPNRAKQSRRRTSLQPASRCDNGPHHRSDRHL
jgi:hypothetical protein